MIGLLASIRSRTGIVLSETLVNTVLALVTYAVIVRITDIATVGLWALVSSLLAFARCVDIWSRGVSTFVAQARMIDGDARAATYVSTAAISGAVGYAIITIIAGPFLYWGLSPSLDQASEKLFVDILPLMMLGFWINSVGSIYQLGFLGFERPALKAIQTIGGSCLFLLVTIWLAPSYGLFGMVVAQIVQGIAMLMFAVPAFHIVMMQRQDVRLFDNTIVIQLGAFGTKAIGLGAMQLLTEPILRLIANYFGGLASVGVVDFASRLCMIPRTFVGSIGQTIVPAFSRIADSKADDKQQLFNRFRSIIVPISISMMASIVGASYLAGWVFIGEKGTDAALITTILGIGWLSNMAVSTEYFMLFGYRKLRLLGFSHAVMIIGMLGLGFLGGLLGELIGAMVGAMLGVVISSWMLFAFTAEAKLHRQIRNGKNAIVLAWATAVVVSIQLYLVSLSVLLPWVAAVIGSGLTGMLVVAFTPWRDLLAITSNIDTGASINDKERLQPHE